MICPLCSHNRTNVTNSRPRKKTATVWRRRQCPSCEHIFSTNESPSLHGDVSIKSRDGKSVDPYNRGILLLSVSNSFAHDPARGRQAAWWLTETIEGSIAQLGAPEGPLDSPSHTAIDAADIASLSHRVLERYDKAAAIQYAAKHNIAFS